MRHLLLSRRAQTFVAKQSRNKCRLVVGARENITKTFTQEEVNKFAEMTGDTNPLHVDREYAVSTGVFDGTIVHGAMLTGLLSALLGTKLPGPGSIVMNQHIKFPSPLYVGRTVNAEVTITNIKKKFVVCAVECKDITSEDGMKVLTGKTTLMYLPPSDCQ